MGLVWKRPLLVLSVGGVLVILVTGCSLPPCMDGKIQVEVNELEPVSTCLFEMWPAESTFDLKTAGSRGNSGDRCELQNLEFLAPPEDAEVGGVASNPGTPPSGYRVGVIPSVLFKYGKCYMTVSGELLVDGRYEDFDAALKGQDSGDDQAFYVQMAYLGAGECPDHPFPASPFQDVCGNTYGAKVTKL